MDIFTNRSDAGRRLSENLLSYRNHAQLIVLALPRGGVPVAFEIAKKLCVPMAVFLVRKLGVPGHEEVAIGAIAEGDVRILDQDLIMRLNITEQQVQNVLKKETQELKRRLQQYRHGESLPDLKEKTVILVDDGIATGFTLTAAIMAVKKLNPKKIIVAVPVASQESLQELSLLVDEVVCLMTPEPFYGVGQWYQRFDQTTDEEVIHLLQLALIIFNTLGDGHGHA